MNDKTETFDPAKIASELSKKAVELVNNNRKESAGGYAEAEVLFGPFLPDDYYEQHPLMSFAVSAIASVREECEKKRSHKITLQEAKESTARHHGYNTWQQFLDYAYDEGLSQIVADYTDEAWVIHTELNELIEEIERLKAENGKLNIALDEQVEMTSNYKLRYQASEKEVADTNYKLGKTVNDKVHEIVQLKAELERKDEALREARVSIATTISSIQYRHAPKEYGMIECSKLAEKAISESEVIQMIDKALNPTK